MSQAKLFISSQCFGLGARFELGLKLGASSVAWKSFMEAQDPHHFGNLDTHPDPHPHQIKIRIRINLM
jgi:hypothetical protein